VAVCAAASLAFYVAAVQPFMAQRQVAVDRANELAAKQDKASELKASLATARERLAAVRQALEAGTIQLESAVAINKRIAQLAQFFSNCGLQVDDVRTTPVHAGPQYDLVPISIVGRGEYEHCVAFLDGLCTTFADMSVVSIDLKGNPGQTSEPERFQFELFWYAAPSLRPANNPSTNSAPVARN